MRTGKIEVRGKEYILCFSARVVRDCSERYGGIEKIGEALTEGTEAKVMDECFWLLSMMMDAGARYAKLEGLNNPAPLSYDDLYDLCDMEDLMGMKARIFETVANGNERTVEVDPEKGKNVEATRQEPLLSGTSGTP